MSEFTQVLIAGFGLLLVFEGLLYGLFPGVMRKMITEMMTMSNDTWRFIGCFMVALGVVIVWLVR